MKKIIKTLLMLYAATMTISADGQEQTPAPVITLNQWINEMFTPDYGDGYKEAFVQITYDFSIEMPDDIPANLFYRVTCDGDEASDWCSYNGTVLIDGPSGYYEIQAYAQLDDWLPSEIVTTSCHISTQLLYAIYLHEGINYYFARVYSYEAAVYSGGNPHNPDEPAYSGDIVIPAEIECQGAIYTVNEIYDNAFTGSDVLSVDLPYTINRVGYGAFHGCTHLRKLICRAITPPLVYASFQDYDDTSDEIYHAVTLFVPAESLEAYRNAWEWGSFTRIVPFIGAGPGDVNGDGQMNIADVTGLIDQLLGGGELPAYIDVNGDGVVNITDVTTLIDQLLDLNL